MYRAQRRLRSQNFLVDRELVNRLIRASSISSSDLVLDIGAGRGVITRELLSVAHQVIAVEQNRHLFNKLKSDLDQAAHLQLVHADFLQYPLPSERYKVFANIPFSLTGGIIRRLLLSPHPPADCYLVVQAEAAAKFMVHTAKNTLAAILYYPFWDIHIVHRFSCFDFSPSPAVDCVLLRLWARPAPFLSAHHKSLYQDFVVYHFTRDRLAAHIPPSRWLNLFANFRSHARPALLAAVRGSFARLQGEQSRLRKIHRTRTDPRWKKFPPRKYRVF